VCNERERVCVCVRVRARARIVCSSHMRVHVDKRGELQRSSCESARRNVKFWSVEAHRKLSRSAVSEL
jgi:hypothetical protein